MRLRRHGHDRGGPYEKQARATYLFTQSAYVGGPAHFFLNALDGQCGTAKWFDDFYVNCASQNPPEGCAPSGGFVPGTQQHPNAWQGLLNPYGATGYVYDHAEGDASRFMRVNDTSLSLLTDYTLYPEGSGDCVGHSFGAISFPTNPCGGVENPPPTDCNDNNLPDACDVANGFSQDCDANGVPDECQTDCNGNGVPDVCDVVLGTSADCNGNGIPDECEPDCNSNSVPDAWDISQSTSADCNDNGIPDECEPDCNSNGVPDDCDIDPTDPDGDEWVSPDCNENEYPDECDIAMGPPWGSLDVDEDGIPDECEEESLRGGGEEGMMMDFGGGDSELGGPCDGLSSDEWYDDPTCAAAWGEFLEWSLGRTWGPASDLTGLEQYQAMVEELDELGLPNPWAR